MDPSVTDGVQPDAGQGDGGQSGGGEQPYAEYLNAVPEEVRGTVEPVFADWNAHVNKQFEQHAEFRKGWEPYEQAGLNQYQPDQLSWALQVAQAAQNDPAAMRAWLDEQHGPVAAAQQDQQPSQDELFGVGYQDPQTQQLEQLFEQKFGPLSQQFQEFAQWRESLEQQQHEARISEALNAEIGQLEQQHAANLPEDVRGNFAEIIGTFASKYAHPGADPKQVIGRAWADFESLSNQLQTAALQQKVNQPKPAESAGAVALSGDAPKTLKEAEQAALGRLRAERAA